MGAQDPQGYSHQSERLDSIGTRSVTVSACSMTRVFESEGTDWRG
jgi:hypothetical protein